MFGLNGAEETHFSLEYKFNEGRMVSISQLGNLRLILDSLFKIKTSNLSHLFKNNAGYFAYTVSSNPLIRI